MDTLGVVCALTLSILDSGYRLEWAAGLGEPPRVRLPNTRAAFENRDFVSAAIAEGVDARLPASSGRV